VIRLALRNLMRRRLRTIFTIAGIAIGTMAYVGIVALADGMREQSQRLVDHLSTDITVTRAGTPVPWMAWIAPEELEPLKSLPGVRSVSSVVVGTTRAGARDLFIVFGADSREPIVQGLTITSGQALRAGRNQMLVGVTGAKQLEVVPGDRLEIAGTELEVAGIFETGRGVLDASAVVDLPVAGALFGGQGRVNMAFINVDDGDAVTPTMNTIRRRYPRLEATPSELFASRLAYVEIITGYARAFAMLALLVAGVMVANTAGMNVNERRQEIALLRSIGWRRRRIAALIAGETALMLLCGGLLAIPLAAMSLRMVDSGDAAWIVPASLGIGHIVESLALALVLGLLFAGIPIVQALRRPPADALRTL